MDLDQPNEHARFEDDMAGSNILHICGLDEDVSAHVRLEVGCLRLGELLL